MPLSWFARRRAALTPASPQLGADRLLRGGSEHVPVVRRPIVRAMTRVTTSYLVPADATSRPRHHGAAGLDRRTLEAARLARLSTWYDTQDPDATFVIELLAESLAAGDAYDLMARLSQSSWITLAAGDAALDPGAARAAAQRVRATGLRVMLGGLTGQADEVDLVAALRPEALAFAAPPPVDFKPQLAHLSRLRPLAERDAYVLVDGVTDAVEEWAATSLGATHLAGPRFALPATSVSLDDGVGLLPRGSSPFGLAMSRFASRTISAAELVESTRRIEAAALAAGNRADLFVAVQAAANLDAEACAAYARLIAADVAVTLVATDLTAVPIPGASWGTIPSGDPLALEWVVVLLVPGGGTVLTAFDLGGEGPLRRYAAIEVEDRTLGLHIAGLISAHAHDTTT